MAITLPVSEAGLPSDRFLDREMSWLAFNQRVLEMAEDSSVYLLERVNFLSIFASNLDEFFMVRVAGLKRRMATGIAVTAASGLSPQDQLAEISARTRELQLRHARLFSEVIRPELGQHGIEIERWDELAADERQALTEYFNTQIFPVLTPLAVDPAHPFRPDADGDRPRRGAWLGSCRAAAGRGFETCRPAQAGPRFAPSLSSRSDRIRGRGRASGCRSRASGFAFERSCTKASGQGGRGGGENIPDAGRRGAQCPAFAGPRGAAAL